MGALVHALVNDQEAEQDTQVWIVKFLVSILLHSNFDLGAVWGNKFIFLSNFLTYLYILIIRSFLNHDFENPPSRQKNSTFIKCNFLSKWFKHALFYFFYHKWIIKYIKILWWPFVRLKWVGINLWCKWPL